MFRALVGLHQGNAVLLLDALKGASATGDVVAGKADEYGRRDVLDFKLTGPKGTAITRSAWIVRADEDVPRLVTYYIP